MKAVLRNRPAIQTADGDIAAAIDELVSANNTQPLEVGDVKIRSGLLTPEGRLAGNPGDLYILATLTLGTLFVKQSGLNTTTGWIAK